MWKEFKEFINRGNVVDLAVGVIIGTSFGAIAQSLVNDVIMPPIGLLLGGVDFSNLFILLKSGAIAAPYASLADAQAAGAVTINYGAFINVVIRFILIAWAMFVLIRGLNAMKRKEAEPAAPTTKDCPYCLSAIPVQAIRCPHCTSDLTPST